MNNNSYVTRQTGSVLIIRKKANRRTDRQTDIAAGTKTNDAGETKPKPEWEDVIKVEQIESEIEKCPTSIKTSTNQNNNSITESLKLPEAEADETSDSSSQLSPHTEGNGDTGDDESIAVNCHTNPSEVIVRGKNVKQIRVKFPPHPPPRSEEVARNSSGRRRLSRCASAGSDAADQPTDATPDGADESIPYSKEETSLPAITETPGECFIDPRASANSFYNQEQGPYSALSSRAASSMVDWDLKHKQDVLSGLEYFERKAQDFKDLYNRSQQEIERLRTCNRDLENRLQTIQTEMKGLMAETEELKIKLDESEKENEILREQAISEWRSRVKAEEMYFELDRDMKQEISELTKQLRNARERQDDGHHTTTDAVTSKAAPAEIRKELREKTQSTKDLLSEDEFELKHSVAALTDEIRRLGREKEAILEKNAGLVQDLNGMKLALEKKEQELDSQYKRFLSLKKSFNALMGENEKLRTQLRSRSQQLGNREQINNALANSTWPAGKLTGNTSSEVETLTFIDLPNDAIPDSTVLRSRRNSLNAKTGKTAAVHSTTHSTTRGTVHSTAHSTVRASTRSTTRSQMKRTQSEAITVGDNLPPVNNTTR